MIQIFKKHKIISLNYLFYFTSTLFLSNIINMINIFTKIISLFQFLGCCLLGNFYLSIPKCLGLLGD